MNQPLGELPSPLPIPQWQWDIFFLDFISGIPRITRKRDSIMVVVDNIIKEAHFIHVQLTFKVVHLV